MKFNIYLRYNILSKFEFVDDLSYWCKSINAYAYINISNTNKKLIILIRQIKLLWYIIHNNWIFTKI